MDLLPRGTINKRRPSIRGIAMSHKFSVTISDDEYRAMQLVVPNPEEWVDHAIKWKAFKCLLRNTQATLADAAMLDPADMQEIQQDLLDAGMLIVDRKKWPKAIHEKITRKSKMKTRAERDENAQ